MGTQNFDQPIEKVNEDQEKQVNFESQLKDIEKEIT